MRNQDRTNILLAKFFGIVIGLAALTVVVLGGAFYLTGDKPPSLQQYATTTTTILPTPTPEAWLVEEWGVSAAGFLADSTYSMLLHADTLMQLMDGRDIAQTPGLQISLPAIRLGKLAAFTAALYVPTEVRRAGKTKSYCRRAPLLLDEVMQVHGEVLRPALSLEDLRRNWREGAVSVWKSVEGSWCLDDGLASIERMYDWGVRMIGLTWHNDHRFATSWSHRGEEGLTELGLAAVKRMNELGIAVDVSHMGDAAIADVLRVARAPVIASHSNCRALCNHRRNLTDEQIRAIAGTGGVIGVNFYSPFLKRGGNASLADVVAHLNHLRAIGGIDCVAIGSDFDGVFGRIPPSLETAAGLPRLREALAAGGFSKRDLRLVFGGNFLRALAEIEKKARENRATKRIFDRQS